MMCFVVCRFMLELKPEQCAEFGKKISQMALNVGCKVTHNHSSLSKKNFRNATKNENNSGKLSSK